MHSRLQWFQRHFTSLPQQGTCTTLSKLSPWGDQIRWSLITVHYACPPYVCAGTNFTPWYGEASLWFKEACSASPPSSGGSGDWTPAACTEAMLPNHYTTSAQSKYLCKLTTTHYINGYFMIWKNYFMHNMLAKTFIYI